MTVINFTVKVLFLLLFFTSVFIFTLNNSVHDIALMKILYYSFFPCHYFYIYLLSHGDVYLKLGKIFRNK